MKYRKEIDGLRSIAIIPVILYHIAPELVPYGFLGVDIFFVISGYLISTIISNKILSKNFSLSEFYERRIKRIAPLYFLIILISTPIAYLILYPHQLTDYFQSIVASLSFLSNFFFYYEIDYFNPFINFSPLIHTWSLSVEEQFYLILPLLLILFKNLSNTTRIYLFTFLATISFIYCIELSSSNISLGFYSSISRAWELLAGVILSLIRFNFFKNFNEKILNLISVTLLTILILIFFGILKFNHPGFFTLIPVLITVLIIQISSENFFLRNILSYKPMVHIGLLSYSLYMIHQPVLSFYKTYKYNSGLDYSFNFFEIIILLTLIYFLSFVSYKFYEKPIRYYKVKKRNVFSIFILLTFVFTSVGLYGHFKRGFKLSFIKKYSEIIKFDRDNLLNEINDLSNQINKSNNNKNNYTLIIGDSMGGDLFLALNYFDQSKKNSYKLLKIDDKCLRNAINSISSTDNISFKCGNRDFTSYEINELIKNSSNIVLTSLWTQFTFEDGIEFSSKINELFDKKIFIIGPAQFSDIFTISVQLSKNRIDKRIYGEFIYEKHIRNDKMKVNLKMKYHPLIINNKNITFIDKFNFFCENESCQLYFIDQYPKIWDDAHLTKKGLKEFGEYIFKRLN